MEHLVQKVRENQEREALIVYLTDSIRAMGEHKYLKMRFIDVLESIRHPRHSKEQSADEIIDNILGKLNEGIVEEDETV